MNGKVCELHHCQLFLGEAEIMYGIWVPSRSPEYMEALETLFPNSFLKLPGGGSYSEEFPKTREVLYCEMCRVAESTWIRLGISS